MFLGRDGNCTLKVKSCRMKALSFERNWILEPYNSQLLTTNFRYTMLGCQTSHSDNSQSRGIFSRSFTIELRGHYNCKSTSIDRALHCSRKFATLYGSIFKSHTQSVMYQKRLSESTLMPYHLWKPFVLIRKLCGKSNQCLPFRLFSPGFVWRCKL